MKKLYISGLLFGSFFFTIFYSTPVVAQTQLSVTYGSGNPYTWSIASPSISGSITVTTGVTTTNTSSCTPTPPNSGGNIVPPWGAQGGETYTVTANSSYGVQQSAQGLYFGMMLPPNGATSTATANGEFVIGNETDANTTDNGPGIDAFPTAAWTIAAGGVGFNTITFQGPATVLEASNATSFVGGSGNPPSSNTVTPQIVLTFGTTNGTQTPKIISYGTSSHIFYGVPFVEGITCNIQFLGNFANFGFGGPCSPTPGTYTPLLTGFDNGHYDQANTGLGTANEVDVSYYLGFFNGICTVPSSPTAGTAGSGIWNAYVYNAGNNVGTGGAWSSNYSGYYTETGTGTGNLSELSTDSWVNGGYPSNANITATGSPNGGQAYSGCPVSADSVSWRNIRTGFDGVYQMTAAWDDAMQILVNGTSIYNYLSYNGSAPVTAENAWALKPSDVLEYDVSQGGGGSFSQLNVTFVKDSLSAGSIANSSNLTACSSYTPSAFTSVDASGGALSGATASNSATVTNGTTTYLWLESINGGAFSAATGTNNTDTYQPAALTYVSGTYTTYAFKRQVTDYLGFSATTNTITFNIYPGSTSFVPLIVGSIATPSTAPICTNGSTSYSYTGTSGGSGHYDYQWDSSVANTTSGLSGTFSSVIGGTGGSVSNTTSTSSTYTPGAYLASPTYYQVTITDANCANLSVVSNVVFQNVFPAVPTSTALTVSSTPASALVPGTSSGSPTATGGVCSGTNVTIVSSGLAPGRQVATLSGSNDLSVGYQANLAITGAMTIEMWVYPTSINPGGTGTVRQGLWGYSYEGVGAINLEPGGAFSSTAGTVDYYYGNGSSYTNFNSTVPLTAGQWNHIALVRGGGASGSTLTWFINGNYAGSTTTSYTIATGGNNTTYLGMSYSSQYLTGSLDAVRIWNIARNEGDIRNDMFKEVPTSNASSGLISNWDFNTSAGNLVDSKSAYNLTNNGSVCFPVIGNGSGTNYAPYYTFKWTGPGTTAAPLVTSPAAESNGAGSTLDSFVITAPLYANGYVGSSNTPYTVTAQMPSALGSCDISPASENVDIYVDTVPPPITNSPASGCGAALLTASLQSPYATLDSFYGPNSTTTFLNTGSSYTDNTLGSATYYVKAANGYNLCKSTEVSISATVTATFSLTPATPQTAGGSAGGYTFPDYHGYGVSCYGSTNGYCLVTSSYSGTAQPPYTYTWSNGSVHTTSSQSDTIHNLAAGTYSVVVRDNSGCVNSASFTLTAPAQIVVPISNTAYGIYGEECSTGSTGAITTTGSGGVTGGYTSGGAYSYLWNNSGSSTTASISSLPAGTYTVTVTDGNSCTVTNSLTLTSPPAITYTPQIAYTCNSGGYTGAIISLNATGGSSGTYYYQYNSGTFSSTNSFTATSNGQTVQVNAEDGNASYSPSQCPSTSTTVTVTYPTTSSSGSCEFIYVSPTGSGTLGTKGCPTSLSTALTGIGGTNWPSATHILLYQGTYNFTSTLTIPAGVIIDGDYIADANNNWEKSSSQGGTYINIAPSIVTTGSVGSYIGMEPATSTSNNWTLQDLTINVVLPSGGATSYPSGEHGVSFYGVYTYGQTGWKISRCNIITAPAGTGNTGPTGSNYTGSAGGAGGGQISGENHCDCGNSSGYTGNNGTAGSGSSGGSAGGGGPTCNSGGTNVAGCDSDGCTPGSGGGNGNNGGAGSNTGGQPSPTYTISGSTAYFTPVQGSSGGAGSGGGGGGSGGIGGSGTDCSCSYGGTAVGGAGGNGGPGGGGGGGGYGGGGSFAVFVYNGSGTLTDCQLSPGGAGGAGGGGGGGNGEGPTLSPGGGACESSCGGACGTNGGTGGSGGQGGTGQTGSSGVSVQIEGYNGSSWSTSPSNVTQSGGTPSTIPNAGTGITATFLSGCPLSEIDIGNGTGSALTLQNSASLVDNLTSSTSSYTTSSNPVAISYPSGTATGFYNLTFGSTVYNNFLRIEGSRVVVPTNSNISAINSGNPVCPSASISLGTNLTTNSNIIGWDWEVSLSTSPGTIVASSTTAAFSGSPVTVAAPSGGWAANSTYQVRLRLQENCCGWSLPVWSSFTTANLPTSGSIAPTTAVCGNSTHTYTVSGVNFDGETAGNYTWAISSGAGSISGTPTGSSATVTWSSSGSGTLSVTPSNTCGNEASAVTQSITINSNPTVGITTSPTPANICLGASVTLTANTSAGTGGSGTFTYNWTNSLSGAAPVLTPGSTGTSTYSVTITDIGSQCTASATSPTVTVVAPLALTLTETPTNGVICSGDNVTLSEAISSGGTGTYDYQWSYNSSAISGSNPGNNISYTGGSGTSVSPPFTLTVTSSGSTTPAAYPLYSISVTGDNSSGCSATASGISVTVDPVPTMSTTLTQVPATVCSGTAATIDLTGFPSGSYSYVITYNINGGTAQTTTVTPSSGAASFTTYRTLTTGDNGLNLNITQVQNSLSTTSNCTISGTPYASVPLSVVAQPTITGSDLPTNQTICPGGTGTLTVAQVDASTGTGTYSYAWSYNGTALTTGGSSTTPNSNFTYTNPSGSTASFPLSLGAVANGSEATGAYSHYTLTLTGNSSTGCSVTTAASTVTVVSPPSLSLTETPGNGIICSGDNVTLSEAISSGGTGTYNYQWDYNSAAISGSNPGNNITYTGGSGSNVSPPFTLTVTTSSSTTPAAYSLYSVSVTGYNSTGCAVTASGISLTVDPAATMSTTLTQVPATVCSGTVAVIDLTGFPTAGSYNYVITYNINGGTAQTTTVTPSGGTASFTTYRTLTTGDNGLNLNITQVQNSSSTTTNCTLTGTPYASVPLSVAPQPTITGSDLPTNQTICPGGTGTLTVAQVDASTGTGTYSYAWSYNGTALTTGGSSTTPNSNFTYTNPSGSTASFPLSLGAVANGSEATGAYSHYTLTLTGNSSTGCSVTTAASTVTVVSPPSLSLTETPTNGVICSGDNVTLSEAITSGGTGTYDYQWSYNGSTISGSNPGNNITYTGGSGSVVSPPFTLTVNSSSSTTPTTYSLYSLSVTGDNSSGCSATASGISLTVDPAATMSTTLTQVPATVCSGTTATIDLTGFPTSAIENYVVTYNINGGSPQTTTVTPNGSGNASFVTYRTLTTSDNGNNLNITQVQNSSSTTTNCTLTGSPNLASIPLSIAPQPTITGSNLPTNQTICPTGTATLTVAQVDGGTGAGTYTYAWYYNGTALTTGGGSTTPNSNFTYTNPSGSSASFPLSLGAVANSSEAAGAYSHYTLTLTGNNSTGCSVTTAASTVTVNAPVTLTLTETPTNGIICGGDNVTLSEAISSGGTGTYDYQWSYNGSTISGSNPGNNITYTGGSGSVVSPPFTLTVNSSSSTTPTTYSLYSLSVTGDNSSGCSATASGISLTVDPAATMSTTLTQVPATVCSGTTATIDLTGFPTSAIENYVVTYNINGGSPQTTTVTPNGSGNASFVTYRTLTTSDNGNNLNITQVQNASSSTSACTLSGSPYAFIPLSVSPQPTITGSDLPTNQTICPTGTATLTVAQVDGGTGTGTYTYAWYYNGTALTTGGGSTTPNSNFTYTNPSGSSASFPLSLGAIANSSEAAGVYSHYTLTLTGNNSTGCSVTTSPASTVTVNAPVTLALTETPTNGVICSGDNVTLSEAITSGGTGTYDYQWSYNGSTISGSNPGNNITYTGGSGSVVSPPFTLTVNSSSSTTPTTYSLYSLSVTGDNSSGCSATASGISLTVDPAATMSTTLTQVPATVCSGTVATVDLTGFPTSAIENYVVTYNINGGSPQTTTVTPNGSGNASFVTYRTLTTSDNGNNLNITQVQNASSSTSACTLSGSPYASIPLSVSPQPTITGSDLPTNQTICPTGTATLTVAQVDGGTGTGTYTYAWYYNGTALTTGGSSTTPNSNFTYTNPSGSSASFPLSLGALANSSEAAGAYSHYTLTLTGNNSTGCSVTTSPASTVTVNPQPTITGSDLPTNTTICPGGSTSLTVADVDGGTGTGSYSYAWSYNGTALTTGGGNPNSDFTSYTNPSGSTASFPLTLGLLTDGGTSPSAYNQYTLTLTGNSSTGCSVTTTPATVTVNPQPTITGNDLPTNQTICQGGTATLTVAQVDGGTGTGSYSYAWYYNSTALTTGGGVPNSDFTSYTNPSGSTASFPLSLEAVTSSSAAAATYDLYTLILTGLDNTGCAVTTAPATITVNPSVSVTISGGTTVCYNSTVTLTSSVSGGAGAESYQWQSSTDDVTFTDISGATSSTYNAPTTAGGTTYYDLVVTFTGPGCGSNTSDTQEVTIVGVATGSTWNGMADDNWFNAANWNDCVPGSITDAIIPIGAPHYPGSYTGNPIVRSLTIESGGSMVLNGGYTLTAITDIDVQTGGSLTVSGTGTGISLGGNWTSAGTFDPGSSNNTLTFTGSNTSTITSGGSGSTFYHITVNKSSGAKLTLANSITANGTLNVANGVFEIPSSINATLGKVNNTTNGTINVKSSAKLTIP